MRQQQQRAVLVGEYVATRRRTGYLVRGVGRKFTVSPDGPGRWRVTIGSGNVGRRRVRVDAPDLASAIERAEDLYHERVESSDAETLTVAAVMDRWMGTLSVQPETANAYDGYIDRWTAWLDTVGVSMWRDLRLEHLQAYSRALVAGGKARDTTRLYTLVVRTCAAWAARNWRGEFLDWTDGYRPPRDLAPKRAMATGKAALSLEDVGSLVIALRAAGHHRLVPYVALQGFCGLRLTEALRMRSDRIEFAGRGRITVEGRVKNQHSLRVLPLPEAARVVLERYLEELDRPGPHRCWYGGELSSAMSAWRSPRSVEPKGLRRTIKWEAERGGWSGAAQRRFIGHSGRGTDEKHYLPTGDQMVALMAEQVVARIDELLAGFVQKWHELWHDERVVALRGRA